MPQELNLEFPTENQVIIHFNDQHSDKLDFQSPVLPEDQKDIRWYLEVYAYLYTTDVDDKRADKIAERLPILGESLLKSVCYNDKAAKLFQQFHHKKNAGRLLTISASQPAILSLPWELLRFNDNYLFHDAPRISIRRRLANLDNAKKPLEFTAKRRLHLLFVVSRPHGASFIDPRTDPIAVLDALDQTGRIIEVEFLRPATLANLRARLKDKTKPPIDILHFDGHGVFKSNESMGYLLFTRQGSWTEHRVPAKGLGLILGSANIPLVILSACQSAAIGESEEPMGTVAVQLTHAGVPSVIAMTHLVHVNATRALFSAFYQHLTQSKGVGEALDNARSDLYQNPDRIELQRGQELVTLKLYDWFLPALYQAGEDTPLLTKPIEVEKPAEVHWGNLRYLQAAGFWGRTKELWFIECAFVQYKTRRFTISGFGGEGKTYLAIEIGYWLYRTGLFEKVCFVDYDAFQGVDAVGLAISTLATVLDKSLVDTQAATAALAQQPTLLILDNLEAITTESLSELLIVAKEWSEIGECRVLLTTRSPDFHHPDYPIEGSLIHQSLALGGLAKDDALKYFQRLLKLLPAPQVELPKREAVLTLFQQVDCHPLSIGLIAGQLKVRGIEELGSRLEKFLVDTPDNPLLASLNLSLDKIDEEAKRWLPKLGVFQGGAMEEMLLGVTGLGQVDENPEVAKYRQLLEAMQSGDPSVIDRARGLELPEDFVLYVAKYRQLLEAMQSGDPKAIARVRGLELSEDFVLSDEKTKQLQQMIDNLGQLIGQYLEEEITKHLQTELAAGVDESTWATLRDGLEVTGLIQAEHLAGGRTYLKFHPTLAPTLWTRLNFEEQTQLQARHSQRYYKLLGFLFDEYRNNPHEIRAIIQRELPNLLFAVHGALDAEKAYAVEFVRNVNQFLDLSGLNSDSKALRLRIEHLDDFDACSNQGEQLFRSGQYQAAAQVFTKMLKGLGEQASYEHLPTLIRLEECFQHQGQMGQAAECCRQGLAVAEQLEPSEEVKRMMGYLEAGLANVLMNMGDYDDANKAYESALTIAKEQGEARHIVVLDRQLGTLSLEQGNLQKATQCYTETLAFFHRLNEPNSEAKLHLDLGKVYQRAEQWDAAEQANRESARIRESQGDLAGAAKTWGQLAHVTRLAGKPEEAEAWYRKAIEGVKAVGNMVDVSITIINLADLLQIHYPNRLPEARQLAEEALAIMQKLDSAAAKIWKIYLILAQIAEKQNDAAKASEYRRKSREAYQGFQGARYQLQEYEPVIAGVVAAVNDDKVRKEIESAQKEIGMDNNLVAAIQHILDGERDEAVLCEPLDYREGAIINAILRGIAGEV